MRLISPSNQFKEQYLQALEESKNETNGTQLNKPAENQSFEDLVHQLKNYAAGLDLPKGWVPDSVFWLVDKEDFIGRVSIRHELTETLLKKGGHIGYYIR